VPEIKGAPKSGRCHWGNKWRLIFKLRKLNEKTVGDAYFSQI
jgi:hypothetical protein